MSILVGALILMAQASSASQAPVPRQIDQSALGIAFDGGDFDGLVTAELVSPSGQHYVGFAPSKPNARPVPATLILTVQGLIDAHLNNRPDQYPKFVQPDAESYVGCSYICETHRPFIGNGFPLKERLTVNTPYYMGDTKLGPLVRIEWLHDGQLWYLSYLHFRDGKVSKINTIRATVPPIYRPSAK